MDASSRHLALHGAVVLVIGLMCGGPYGRAINRNAPAHIVQAWRVAHSSLPAGAVLMFAVAPLLSLFTVAAPFKWFIALALIVSSYAFCVSLPLAAVVGHRGLSPAGPLSARLVYAGNIVGAAGAVLAALVLVYAAFVSL